MRGKEGAVSPEDWRIFETRQFLRDLEALGPSARRRLETKLREHVYPLLRRGPYWGPQIKRLANWEPPTWRYRIGEWRFFYELDAAQRIVFMITADHRRQAYRR